MCKKRLMIPEWLPQAVIRGRTGQRKGTKKKEKRTNKTKTKQRANQTMVNTILHLKTIESNK